MNQGPDEDDGVLVLLPLPADPLFVDAVDEAIAGDVAAMPAIQPDRPVGGKSSDFASLYIRHRASFALHARRFLNDPRDVDEVLQEAFLRLFLAMPELENELQALTYCRRTVTNLCIDRYRADQRRPRLVDLEMVEWDPSDVDSYDDPVLRAEDAAIVREALALLSPLHREALIKREIEEKSLPQIAAELDIPEESVKHLLYRARRSLRRLLVGTSVEPGVDLSATQALRLANERLARATLRSANVLIVLFVAAVTVVGALRVGLNDQQRRSGEDVGLVSPELGLGGNPAASPRVTTPRNSGKRAPVHSKIGPTPPVTNPPPAGAPAQAASSRPSYSKPDGWRVVRQPVRVRTVAAKPAYTLRGSLRPTGPVQVQSLPVFIDPVNGAVAKSVLSAPTTTGVFSLTQTIAQSTDGSASVSILPQLANETGVITTGVASSAAVTRDPSGTLSVDIAAKNSTPTGPASPVGDLTVHLVLGGDLSTVLAESVIVSANTDANVTTSASVVTPPIAVPPTTCSSSTVTGTAGVAVTSVQSNTVIGISPESLDDPQGQCSSTNNGGSVPLLPSPAQP